MQESPMSKKAIEHLGLRTINKKGDICLTLKWLSYFAVYSSYRDALDTV